MNEPPADFDLKLMPDWLKQTSEKNPYADYEVREPRGFGRERGDRQDRGGGRPRQGNDRGERRGRGDDNRSQKSAPQDRATKHGEKRREHGAQSFRGKKPGQHPSQKPSHPQGQQQSQPRAETQAAQPAPVRIEFLPDANCVAGIAKQIKATNRAWSLFDLARMFLAKPERHRVRIISAHENAPLFQAGENGPVSLDRAAVERAAFDALWPSFYVAETIQRDPPKGNFTNVARHRLSGVLLGPTNYHDYQPALRRLYDERFSRRMSFQDFLRDVETVSNPALVEQWKENMRMKKVYKPLPAVSPAAAENPIAETAAPTAPNEENKTDEKNSDDVSASDEQPENAASSESNEPQQTDESQSTQTQPTQPEQEPAPVFNSIAEAEQHFRQHHLESIIRSAQSVEISGATSRALADRRITAAVRQAWEKERSFPGQMMHHLRVQFLQIGLHVFKHKKRMQFVSAVRPAPFVAGKADAPFSPLVSEILRVIETSPNCTRATLASALLPPTKESESPDAPSTSPEIAQKKTALAADLRWLINEGRVIEFFDGKLELPYTPPPAPAKPEQTASMPKKKSEDSASPTALEAAADLPQSAISESPAEPLSKPLPANSSETFHEENVSENPSDESNSPQMEQTERPQQIEQPPQTQSSDEL